MHPPKSVNRSALNAQKLNEYRIMNELKRQLLDTLDNGCAWYKKILDYGTDRDYHRGLIQGIMMARKIVGDTDFNVDEDKNE